MNANAPILSLGLLEDAPLPAADMPPGRAAFDAGERRRRELQMREALEGIMQGADSAGYAMTTFGSLAAIVADGLRQNISWILENPWAIREALDAASLVSAPDPLLERRRLKERDNVVLYRSDRSLPFVRSRPYQKGLLLVKFLTLAFQPLADREMVMAKERLSQRVSNPLYHRHLGALLRWFNQRRRLLDARTMRSFREITTADDRRWLMDALLDVASLRGHSLTPKQMHNLDRLATVCGHSPGEIHSLLHRRQSAAHSTLLLPAAPTDDSGQFDPALVEQIEQSTSAVQLLLAEVFDDTPEPPPAAALAADALEEFGRRLRQREQWSLAEAGELAATLLPGRSLMTILEEVNDLAVERTGDIIADIDADIIYINN